MISPIDRAISLLQRGNTCVICDRDRVLTSNKSGIAPLLERYERGEALNNVAVADRIIGKASAMLLILMGVSEVYGGVMSQTALDLLKAAGISVRYETLVPMIVNRKGDGPCPMEKAVADLTDPKEAPAVLRAALNALSAQSSAV